MRRLLPLIALSLVARSAGGQVPGTVDSIRDDRGFSFYERGPYRPQVPRPDSLLGYGVGELQTQFAWQERVLLAIAASARDRVRVEEIGITTERRVQRLYLISAPENLQRLDAIRADLDRLADPRALSAAEADAIAARVPAVVWINESVHGDESPGFESAMQTMYQLAASDEPATVSALKNVLVVLNPSTNPDGHERFSAWYNSISVRSPEPFALEYNQPWSISGRYNHYRFDMNRDVMTTTQKEARTLLAGAMRWHPMVTIDQHGYTYSFFFPPTARPMNSNLGGDFQKWMEIFGKGNATAFDRYGWMYYSRDIFDFYGPFYWDLWPSLTGAIGMTYETDCRYGIVTRREDGTLCSFRAAIAKHFVAAMATIETTSGRRAERVRDWVKFRREAVDEGRTAMMKRVVVVPASDPARAAALAATLLRSGIEVRKTTEAFSSARAHAYADDGVSAKRFEAGAYVIDLAQPQGRAARAVLEPAPAMDTAFSRMQVERFQRNTRRGANVPREGYEFYDVTAWSLPVTFGVEAYWTEDAGPVSGPLLTRVDESFGGITGARPARSAYVFPSDRNGAPRLAYQLLARGYRLGLSERALEAGGRRFARGAYVVRVARNDSTLHARLDQLARESGVEVFGVNSAFSDVEQFGIGSEAIYDLKLPTVALVGDEGIGQSSYGATWYVLEQRYGIPFTPVSTRYLAVGDLARFNVIIMPDATPGTLNRVIGKDGADHIREWVRGGGTLVTFAGSSWWAARENVNLTSARIVGADAKPDSTGAATKPDTAAARRQQAMDDLLAVTSPSSITAQPADIPGSHFDVVLDRTHWLTSGFENPRVTVMLYGASFLTLSKEGANVGVFPKTGKLQRAGWVWPDNTERLLRNSAFLIHEPTGGGHVVLFANDPFFRAWWHAIDRLVLNAMVLGPAF